MIDERNRFCIEEYGKKSLFCSFLPGISGEKGIPIWSYYINRGQCMSCFGSEDKDHSIMEFYPAHQAYLHTKRLGFRTFLKVDGKFAEAFLDEDHPHKMCIGMNELEIEEENREIGLRIQVEYFTLPEEPVGGLVRVVRLKNMEAHDKHVECLDGMPAILPYGVSEETMNIMGQTAKAWMQAFDVESGAPYFHVRASMEDSAEVKEVKEGNFGFAYADGGEVLPAIVNTTNIFGYDASLGIPHHFMETPLQELLDEEQVTFNEVPCCFFGREFVLKSDEEVVFYEVFGQAAKREIVDVLHDKAKVKAYFVEKKERAVAFTEQLTRKIHTRTADPVFDMYCKQTYLDNLLRGGEPVRLGSNKVFYLYSRKHGDMERDYNFFKMLPEFYSQGNGNFRDVNQNRRCDTAFSPYVGDINIKLFYNAIQINGYNPLGIEKMTYYLSEEDGNRYCERAKSVDKKELFSFLTGSFTPGQLYQRLENCHDLGLFEEIIDSAVSEGKTKFGEGYWSDHWTYNLDLIESYLSVYPECEEELLFKDKSYTYIGSQASILPRRKRYQITDRGVRQYHFLKEMENDTYLNDENGQRVQASLMEKLLLLCVLKFAALDSYGMGIEMEGGKPGWYDALNGLPGLCGSSMAETYELSRLVEFCVTVLKKNEQVVELPNETAELLEGILEILEDKFDGLLADKKQVEYWNLVNDCKETYWEQVAHRVSGQKRTYQSAKMLAALEKMQKVLLAGIEKAMDYGKGIAPCYFYYEVSDYEKTEQGIVIKDMNVCQVPYFLEGPVRYLKLPVDQGKKQRLCQNIKHSDLYDEKLRMYKVNASLKDATYELGRASAFTSGWLENESIWLHMEYKYLLELLKNGFYDAFIEDFKNAAIPFLETEQYGRSLLENSSFIASSANPNPHIHGKGFVARLSGSTVEFLNIWQIMMFGKTPFLLEGEGLVFSAKPMFPFYLLGVENEIETTLLGEIPVTYHLTDDKNYIPGNYEVERYEIGIDGEVHKVEAKVVTGELCHMIRAGKVDNLNIYLKR